MTRIEWIRTMPIEDIAHKIIESGLTDEYCHSDCDDDDCKGRAGVCD